MRRRHLNAFCRQRLPLGLNVVQQLASWQALYDRSEDTAVKLPSLSMSSSSRLCSQEPEDFPVTIHNLAMSTTVQVLALWYSDIPTGDLGVVTSGSTAESSRLSSVCEITIRDGRSSILPDVNSSINCQDSLLSFIRVSSRNSKQHDHLL